MSHEAMVAALEEAMMHTRSSQLQAAASSMPDCLSRARAPLSMLLCQSVSADADCADADWLPAAQLLCFDCLVACHGMQPLH